MLGVRLGVMRVDARRTNLPFVEGMDVDYRGEGLGMSIIEIKKTRTTLVGWKGWYPLTVSCLAVSWAAVAAEVREPSSLSTYFLFLCETVAAVFVRACAAFWWP